MGATASLLTKVAKQIDKPEAEVISLAMEAGLRQLLRERVLGQYLKGEITREEAADEVGIDLVELAERQRQAAFEDLEWAFRDQHRP